MNPGQAFRNGDLDLAESLCDQALAASPTDVSALRIKGMVELRKGRTEEAIGLFHRALEGAPNDFLTLEWLQGAFIQTGRYREGLEAGERALALRPHDVNILLGLGQASLKAGDPPRAIRYLERASSLAPTGAAVRYFLGRAYEKAKRNRDALAQYRETVRLQPSFKEAYGRASRLLLEDGRFAAALKLCEQAICAVPSYGEARLQAAQALAPLGRKEEAERMALRAIEQDASLAAPVANWLQSYGRSQLAQQVLERSIQERPAQGRAYYGLVRARKLDLKDRPFLAQMEKILETKLPLGERLALLRALGKGADDLTDFEIAMRRFDEAAALANTIYGAEGAFDARRLNAARESLIGFLDRAFLERNRQLGITGHAPIFVIGMIRSGTTLVQQILTSHPDVGDAGELPFWTTAYPAAVDLDAQAIREPEFIEARDGYLDALRRLDADSVRVANKWPMNYAFAGLLLLAYPDAKIINVFRNPVDTALSIYMSDLGEPPPEFSYDKRHIVDVYRDYQQRMLHWESVLSSSSMLSVRYEDLVDDQERWTRRMIEFCGLPWNDRCLAFYDGDRLVNTPSMVQVRRPIYKTSVDKWKNYQPWLGPFAELSTSL